MHEGKSGPHHAVSFLAHVTHPNFHLVVFPIDLFFSWSKSRKNDMAKRLAPFDVRKVPESKKHAKTKKSAS
jgi:hypothetical protein